VTAPDVLDQGVVLRPGSAAAGPDAAGRTDPMRSQPARVMKVRRETHDTFTLEMAPADDVFPPFAPGQFSMLYVFGVAELPISISGDPANNRRRIYTVRSVGAATAALVGRPEGECVGVRGPFGAGWPMAQARGRDVLLVAGGIGLAPLRPVMYEILARRQDYARVLLLYGARSPRDLLYRKELAQWGRDRSIHVLTTVDYGGLDWKGNVGVVTTLFRRVHLDPRRTTAMICGPEVMMRFVTGELHTRGMADEDIWLSMERNMKCGIGLCGHCQFGPEFICRDGPVLEYGRLRPWLTRHEI
jgi:NAD(P)H-flavin reductase